MIPHLFQSIGTFYDDPAPPPTPPPPPPPPPPAPRTFTQSEVDKLMADHRKTLQTQNADLITQLEEVRSTVTLTQQQRDELDARINSLSQQHLTESQKTQAAMDALNKKYKTDTENLSVETKRWRSQFESSLIGQAIATAAVEHKAASPEQLAMMLMSRAKVVEIVDDKGQPTGTFEARLPMKVTDPKTKVTTEVELPLVEAVGQMRKDEKNLNLFIIDGKPGFGGTGGGSGKADGPIDWAALSPVEHREARKKLKLDRS